MVAPDALETSKIKEREIEKGKHEGCRRTRHRGRKTRE